MTRTPGGSRRLLACVAVVALAATAGCLGAVADAGEPETSIQFAERTNASGLAYETDGGGAGNGDDGVYVADYDRDGWRDVLAVGGEAPALFRNDGGTFARDDAFPTVGGEVKSALFVDYDGDRWEDLVLLRSHATPVVLHNEEGTFERTGMDLGNLSYPMGATAGDYDGDGDADLLVYQSGDWANGKPEGYFSLYQYLEEDNGHPNVLYENTGDGFERVADSGIGESERWSLAASFVDLNDDGRPDVHVANDYNTDTVYINEGDGTFAERVLRGNTSRNGMSSEVADVNGDGHPDVFTTNIYLPLEEVADDERYERLRLLFGYVLKSGRTKGNTMMINDGSGNLSDEAVSYGVREGGWGWAASLTDFDNDGDRDLLHATQHVVRIDRDDPHYTYPMLFERDGDRFQNRNASAHGLTEHDGRGLVAVDYDRDGDREVVVAPYDGEVTVYENVGETGNSLAFRVVNADGVTAHGAEVTVADGGDRTVVRQTSESDFLSQEPRVTHVGLGGGETVDLTVTWPDGTERTFEDVPANRQVRVTPDGLETVARYDA